MLGGADNPNGELPSYITGADISRLHGFKSQRGTDYPFQLAVIAFNDVIALLNLSVFNV